MGIMDALENALLSADDPIVTDYGLYSLGRNLVAKREWAGEPIEPVPTTWSQADARAATATLRERGAIAPDADFNSSVWRIVQSSRSGTAEEVACIADPFCYVSHLSAMQRYGLTDRSPVALHLTTPAREVWNTLRDAKLVEELGADADLDHPALSHVGFSDSIRRRPVVVHETRRPARPVPIRGERARITSIGRTFVDMLSEPRLSGGMQHVLDVWEGEAPQWSDRIIEAIDDQDAQQIVKVRAGYILSERLGIEDARIDNWLMFAQRGGSRKLDPDSPYSADYSERWMISLNV